MQCHAVQPIIMSVKYIMLSFFLYYVFHLSTTFVYSTTLPVHQPFEAVIEVSGVKTRFKEQSRQCYLLKQTSCWLKIAPQRRIQRLMTSPISPLRSMLKLGRVILPMSCMLSCIAQFLHHIWIAICLLAYYINHIFELYHAIMFTQYIHIICLNYGMATHLIKTSYTQYSTPCSQFRHHICECPLFSI